MSTIQAGRQATVSVDVGASDLRFETGKLAKQADGAVVVRSGDTMILATAVGRPDARPDADFFPLTVDVEERMYAAGKIPGGFFKREGRATERATLTARMIDRPIRPLWPKGFKNEVQVICTVLSADMVVPHDILAINGASAALAISPLPFLGPVGAVRVAMIDGQMVVNPTFQQMEESTLDLIVVGTREALTMIEAGGDQVPEQTLLEAFELAHGEIIRICDAIDELAREVGKPKWIDVELNAELADRHGDAVGARIAEAGLREAGAIVEELLDENGPSITMDSSEEDIVRETQVRNGLQALVESQRLAAVEQAVREQFEDELRALIDAEQDSKELKSRKREILVERIQEELRLPFPGGDGEDAAVKDGVTRSYVKKAADAIYKDLVRKKIAVDKRRPDGRGAEEIRPITTEVDVAPQDARLGALHPRADADPDALHARHREGAAADRRPLARAGAPLHAPLQLPAVLGRGDGLHARPEAARHRPRSARAARARGGDPAGRGVPLHDPARLRDARVERLVVDGLRVRLDDVADARGRADHGARLGHRDGSRQGGRRLRHPHRHPGRGGPPGRHGLQGRRHRRGHHRPPDGHQDHRRHAGDHALGSRAGEAGARVRSSTRCSRRSRARGPSSPGTPRGSRRSASTPTSSAW